MVLSKARVLLSITILSEVQLVNKIAVRIFKRQHHHAQKCTGLDLHCEMNPKQFYFAQHLELNHKLSSITIFFKEDFPILVVVNCYQPCWVRLIAKPACAAFSIGALHHVV
jgi:hypothetical protein